MIPIFDRVVEENQDAISSEALQRPTVVKYGPSNAVVIVVQDRHYLFGLGCFSESGKAPQVAENQGDLSPMSRKGALLTV